jgi:hypothetical protein
MRKVRWFGVTWPLSMFTLAKRLKALPFEDERTMGFLVDRASRDSIDGRFFERISYSETIRDPRGTEYQFERVAFNSVEFRCSTSFPQLQVADAPRSTKSFMNLLSQSTDFEMTIDALTVDLAKWIKAMEGSFPENFRCDAVRLSEFPVSEFAKARVEIASSKDIRGDKYELLNMETRPFDRAQLRFEYLGAPICIVITRDAVLRSDNEFPPELTSVVRNAFVASWEE